ncbi:MAG: alpha-(1-_3)-arabinofuranosyltransferase family protein [Acidimicrobiia bacterium]
MTDLHVAADRRRTSRGSVIELVGFALLAYVPFLLSSPGKVSADTKQYLYLDPGRFLARAFYLWDAHVGMGTVPHQQIGYLFPMGPFFWLLRQAGLPVWIAQRLWLGTIVFAAALGARWLFRELGVSRIGALAGALVYMFTPYQLAFTARISVLLISWAGLPFLVIFVMRATRRGGWRDPALFALVVLMMGSVNASSMELVGLAPLVWVVFELGRGRASARRALAASLRIGVLCLGVSMWWLLALRTQAVYGLPVLDLTETLKTVAASSTPTDVMRGIGNWFFYGRDRLGTTLEQTTDFTNGGIAEIASWALPVAALAAAATIRWRHRAYFAVLVVVGTIVGVGAWPFANPSVYGRLFRAFSDGTAVGLSLRNTPRVVPVLVLGLAGLLAAGVSVLAPKWRELGGIAVVGGLVFVAFLPVWRVGYFSSGLERDEDIPDSWIQAAAAIDAGGSSTRVLEIPGSNFAAYRWGNLIEPVTPGITDRPYVAREVLPLGTPGTVDLLDALDHRIQEGTFEPDSLAAVARIMGVGTVSLRSDLEYERFNTPRPKTLWHLLTDPVPAGLVAPQTFGDPVPNVASSKSPQIDPLAIGTPTSYGDPPPVSLFGVDDPVGIVHTAPSQQPVLISGDGDGIVDAAAAGLIDGRQLVLESAALTRAQLRQALASGADVVFTDSNRRRWQTYFDRIRDSVGATEPAGSRVNEFRLETFPGTNDDFRTVLVPRGGVVTATGYVTATDRPANAFDGNPRSAWLIDSSNAEGATIAITASRPVPVDHVTLQQRRGEPHTIRTAEVRINGGEAIPVELGPESFTTGTVVSFPMTDVHDVEVRIDSLEAPQGAPRNGVGFSEISFGNAAVTDTVRLPIDITTRAGAELSGHRLDVVLSRLRYDPAQRPGEELALLRQVVLPDSRAFGLTGTARVDANAPDPVIDAALGTTAAGAEGAGAGAASTVYSSSSHLRGDAGARASSAFDHDPSTAWVADQGNPVGQWVDVAMPTATTVDHLDLTYALNGLHSIPTQVHLEADGVPVRSMTVDPGIPSADGTRATTTIRFDPFVAREVRLVIDAVVAPPDPNSDGLAGAGLPVAVVEASLPGVPVASTPIEVPSACRSDLVMVNGAAVPVRITGPVANATTGLDLESCVPSVSLDAGRNQITTTDGYTTGIDVDRMVLSSDATGAPAPVQVLGTPLDESGAQLRVESAGRVSYDLSVKTDGKPFWLVLGQSQSDGWEATVNGKTLDSSTMVNGYANGWLIHPGEPGTLAISLQWTPQRVVWIGIAVSIVAILACLVIVGFTWRRRRARADEARTSLDDAPGYEAPADARGGALPLGTTVALTIAAGVGAAVVSRWWIGVLVAAGTALGAATSRGRIVLSAGAPVALALGALFDVPELGWLAITLLGADVLLGWWRERISVSGGSAPTAS